MRDMIRTHDAEIIIGWPTTDQDEQQLTVGIVYYPTVGDPVSAWATLDSPEQVAVARRALQRGGRVVWPRETEAPETVVIHQHITGVSPGAELHAEMVNDAFDKMRVPSPFGPVATGLVTPEASADE